MMVLHLVGMIHVLALRPSVNKRLRRVLGSRRPELRRHMRVLLEAKLGHHLERRRPLVQMHCSILLLAEVRRMHWRLIEALTLEWIPLHVFIRRLSI